MECEGRKGQAFDSLGGGNVTCQISYNSTSQSDQDGISQTVVLQHPILDDLLLFSALGSLARRDLVIQNPGSYILASRQLSRKLGIARLHLGDLLLELLDDIREMQLTDACIRHDHIGRRSKSPEDLVDKVGNEVDCERRMSVDRPFAMVDSPYDVHPTWIDSDPKMDTLRRSGLIALLASTMMVKSRLFSIELPLV